MICLAKPAQDVADWLRDCGFESLTNLFEKEGVDGEVLLSLTLPGVKNLLFRAWADHPGVVMSTFASRDHCIGVALAFSSQGIKLTFPTQNSRLWKTLPAQFAERLQVICF